MKRLLTLAALLGAASLSFGQGVVNFSAGATVATRIATNSAPAGPSTGYISGAVGSYYFGLFVAPSTTTTVSGMDPTASGFTFTGSIGTNSNVGRFTGNPTTDDVSVAGYGAGTTASFVVVGWSANYGATWSSAIAGLNGGAQGLWGVSSVAQVQLGGGAIPAGNIFGAQPGQITGFTLDTVAVPEPGTFALAGLGAAALLIFRRRK